MEKIDLNYIDALLDNDSAAQAYTITSDASADWAIEQIMTAQAERDRIIKIANDRIAMLQQQKAQISARCDRNTAFLTDKLREYFATVTPSSVTKTQTTYRLLTGKLVMKKQQPEYVRDEIAMLPWIKSNAPLYVKVAESVNWGELKKATVLDGEHVILAETGEVVPGVVAVARPDVFEVQK